MKKLNKLLAVITALAIALSMMSLVSFASASVVDSGTFGTSGSNLSWSLTSDGVLTISGTGAMEDFSQYTYTGTLSDVPWSSYKRATYNSYGVSVTSVVIEEGVTTIGRGAFYGFALLSSVSLPSTLLEIHGYAFVGAIFTSIDIPASVTSIDATSYLLVAQDGAALTSGGAFRCGNLTTINVSADNKYYSDIDGVLFNKTGTELVFYPEGRTDTSYVIPDGVTTIADGAFYNCQYLNDITIPASVTSIGVEAFCSERIKTVTISEDVSGLSIDEEAFLWSSIKTIDIPAGVTNIEESAFRECYSLSSVNVDDNNQNYCDIDGVLFTKDQTVLLAYPAKLGNTSYTIPEGVVRIGNYAFDYGVNYLETLYVPDTVTSIGCAFSSPTNGEVLTDVYYYGSETEWNAIDVTITASYNEGLYNATIHYDYGNSGGSSTTYTVTVAACDHGTVTASPETAAAGDTVALTITPAEGYEVSSVTVAYGSGTEVTVAADYTFTMPENDVTVTVVFAEKSGGSSTDDPSTTTTYTVTTTQTSLGTVTVTPTSAEAGATVTVKVTANTGYTVAGITVKDASGSTVKVSGSNGVYTFTMPSSAVTITPLFTADSSSSTTEHTHTYVFVGWTWSSDLNSAIGTFYCSTCGNKAIYPATVTSSTTYGVVTKNAAIYLNGVWYTDSKIDTSSTSNTSTSTTNTTTTTTTETVDEVIQVEDPIESTETDTEPDDSEPEEVTEPETESNPTTGVAISLIPMAIAALAAVSSKRR